MEQFKHIGTVSSGTLRPEDLIPAFLDVLAELDAEKAKEIRQEYEYNADAIEDMEDLDYMLEALFSALNDLAPPYFYFGMLEGDGAEFGFWFDRDSFGMASQDGEVIPWDEADRTEADKRNLAAGDVQYLANITDHGNISLFTLEGKEIWAIV